MHAIANERGLQSFHRERAEGEVDLISYVEGLLRESGKSEAIIDSFKNHHFIAQAINSNSDVQRHYLNRYLHLQLVSVPANSTQERFCLVPNGTVEDWMRLFKAKVLPFMIEHDLPKIIGLN